MFPAKPDYWLRQIPKRSDQISKTSSKGFRAQSVPNRFVLNALYSTRGGGWRHSSTIDWVCWLFQNKTVSLLRVFALFSPQTRWKHNSRGEKLSLTASEASTLDVRLLAVVLMLWKDETWVPAAPEGVKVSVGALPEMPESDSDLVELFVLTLPADPPMLCRRTESVAGVGVAESWKLFMLFWIWSIKYCSNCAIMVKKPN